MTNPLDPAGDAAQFSDPKDSAGPASPTKPRYERPRITFQQPLEVMAVICTPSPPAKGNPGACPGGPSSS